MVIVQLLFGDPLSALQLLIVIQVVCVGVIAECVMFLRRWELYLGLLIIAFAGLLVTFLFCHRPLALAAAAAAPTLASSEPSSLGLSEERLAKGLSSTSASHRMTGT